MVFLENALESKLNPLVALGRSGSLGLSGFVNKFNADAELLDDLVGTHVVQIGVEILNHTRTTTGQQSPIRFVSLVSMSWMISYNLL